VTAAGPAGEAAWAALLPGGTVWLGRPWWLLRSRRAPGVRAYIAVPSRQHPLIVASWDRAVLRYLAGTVLSVPPGAGQLLSMVATAGLRLLRYPGSWPIAAALGAGDAVLVGRHPG
jgi:hypothetical protein